MDDPRNSVNSNYSGPDFNEFDDDFELLPTRKRNRDVAKTRAPKKARSSDRNRRQKRERVESRDGTFRCRHCKTIVGLPISGGRHRNHCPLCLYSRHVDRSMPGDRAAECRSMMTPAGVFTRRDGEQMLLHMCSGCGVERRNRIAADDNVVVLMRLPVIDIKEGEPAEQPEKSERSA